MGSLGSYYSPEPLRPIPHTSGLGNDSGASNGPAMVGALLVLGIIGAAFMGAK